MGSLRRTPAGRARPVGLLSAVLVGLLTGGMVLIEVVLLPFWRSVPPEEFRRWFTANAPRIRALMVPLGAAAGASPAMTADEAVTEPTRAVPATAATSWVLMVVLLRSDRLVRWLRR